MTRNLGFSSFTNNITLVIISVLLNNQAGFIPFCED